MGVSKFLKVLLAVTRGMYGGNVQGRMSYTYDGTTAVSRVLAVTDHELTSG